MAVNSFNAQNPPVTTKGDLFTFSTIPTRLGVGANNTVLTADSTAATGLKWATVSSGGWTLLNSGGTSLSGSSVTISSISGSYKNLHLFVYDDYYTSGGLQIRINGRTSNYSRRGWDDGTAFSSGTSSEMLAAYYDGPSTSQKNFTHITFADYANTSTVKSAVMFRFYASPPQNYLLQQYGFYYGSTGKTDAITSITMLTGGAFSGGTAYLYGES